MLVCRNRVGTDIVQAFSIFTNHPSLSLQIEGEVKKLQTQAVRLKSQLDLELTGATEESTKLQTTLH